MLLIRNGYMIDPKSGLEGKYDLLIEADKIKKIGKHLTIPDKNCRVIDAEGLLAESTRGSSMPPAVWWRRGWWMSMSISGIPDFRIRKTSPAVQGQRQKEALPQS